MTMNGQTKGRVLLAYSGGLDTSCILKWLIQEGYEVMAYIANLGQDEDFDAARQKALKVGATKVFVEDLREEFVRELIFPAVQANAIYENIYLLGTSLARPIIARKQIEIAKRENCTHVSHGCTGKGNDQVRFELAYLTLAPHIKVISPWRQAEFYKRFPGRQDLLKFASENGIPVSQTPSKPWSCDDNLYHISYEAGILEDPNVTPLRDMWRLTVDPEDAPNTPEFINLTFTAGIPTRVQNEADNTDISNPLDLFIYLNSVACRNGIGRLDIVENRFIGIKSRGCYETPAGTIMRVAHIDIEGLVMDREVRAYRDEHVSLQYGKILYNGMYFSPEGQLLKSIVSLTQACVNGTVRLKLYKGNVIVIGRWSDSEKLYDMEESSMDVQGDFEPIDSEGFIKIQSIRLKKYGREMKH
ncbi:Argininosuccinate synthase [Smittium culicis]|uniref:Argininosuccinate synthase n=1 Tax=Smittium culicis TaxID=133412 RepID=A0A1R1XW73_9FUNG|nr:Argininosuccinate synthase [Smittium culicis]OMJ18789.1 Argininosuccinate synthase [Smittium culicis]